MSRGAALLGASAGAVLLATFGTASIAQAVEPALDAGDVTLAPTPTQRAAADSASPARELTESVTPDGDASVRQADGATALTVPRVAESVAPKDPAETLAPVVGQVAETVAPVLEQAEPLAPVLEEVAETVAPVLEQAEPLTPVLEEVAETVAPVLEQAGPLAPVLPQPADDGALDVSPPAEEDGRGGVVRWGHSDSPVWPAADTALSGCAMDTAAGPFFVVCRSYPGDRHGENRSPASPEAPLPAGTVSPVTPPSGGAPSPSPAGPAPAVPPSTTNGGGMLYASPEAIVDASVLGLSARAPPAAGQVSGGPRQRERIPPTTPD